MTTGIITADSLNIRAMPNSTASIIGSVASGQSVTILQTVTGSSYNTPQGTRNDWHKIKKGSLEGYVAAFYVNANGQVNASSLNLRTQPDANSLIILSIVQGTTVKILQIVTGASYNTAQGLHNTWYKIEINGQQGFVAGAFVSPNGGGGGNNGSKIIKAINQVNADQAYYQKQDGLTFCNWFFGDVLYVLNIPVPRYDASAGKYRIPHPIFGNNPPHKIYSAEHLYNYFQQQSQWKEVNITQGVTDARNNLMVAASYPGQPGSQGHIAIIRPDSVTGNNNNNIRIAQAGRVSSNNLAFNSVFSNILNSTKFFTFK